MLVLTRRPGQTITIGDDIQLTVVALTGGGVRLGIKAPPAVTIMRGELVCRNCDHNHGSEFCHNVRCPNLWRKKNDDKGT